MEVSTIAEKLLFTTIRIETDQGTGTGFIFGYDLDVLNPYTDLTGIRYW